MVEFTTNLHFSLVNFNVATWHDEVNDNFRSLDALISAFTGITGLLGPWKNSTTYVAGQRVIDTNLNSLWEVAIGHTSGAAGTFAADRVLHPTFWTLLSPAIPNPYNVVGNFSVGGSSTFNGTVTATNTVTLSPANKNVILSPTGTGEVHIDPTILEIAPVTNGNMDNVDIGVTVPREVHATTLVANGVTNLGNVVNASGLITAINGIDSNGPTTLKGETGAGSAAAGDIGEIISSTVLNGAAVALVTGVDKTITSITLTAGDWVVYGNVGFFPAATTSVTYLAQSLSLVTNVLDTAPGVFSADIFPAIVVGASAVRKVFQSMVTRLSLAAPTTVFLVASSTFTVAANTGYGKIWARRAR